MASGGGVGRGSGGGPGGGREGFGRGPGRGPGRGVGWRAISQKCLPTSTHAPVITCSDPEPGEGKWKTGWQYPHITPGADLGGAWEPRGLT